MAALVGGHERSWQGYEKGDNLPGSEVLQALAKLGFNTNWILTGEGHMYKADHQATKVADSRQEIVREPDAAASYSTISIQELIRDLMDIMDSNDEGTKLAITQNIKMFKESVRRKQKLDAETDFKIQKQSGGKD